MDKTIIFSRQSSHFPEQDYCIHWLAWTCIPCIIEDPWLSALPSELFCLIHQTAFKMCSWLTEEEEEENNVKSICLRLKNISLSSWVERTTNSSLDLHLRRHNHPILGSHFEFLGLLKSACTWSLLRESQRFDSRAKSCLFLFKRKRERERERAMPTLTSRVSI